MLIEGKSVVVKGLLKINEFRGQQTLSLFVRNLSLCTMPQKFEKNELVRKVATNYSTITPMEYVEERQSYLFDEKETGEVAPYLIGKTFVVFDFETTGLDTRRCKIIEIGAVKIIDGKIRETFTSLINPHEPLEPDTIKTTNITDDMLEGQPDIEDVFPDFHKFCEDTILVGHNSASFDLQILNRVAGEFKFKFPTKSEDTLLLARRFLKLRNYKLSTLAKYYEVTNENAHRALADAVATAKIFINLAKFM
jgi:DNA polymerase-3 subunit alpha (Gram-positive type)